MDASTPLVVLERSAPPRRRGRPARSVDEAAQAARVALDEFAAARAYLQGLSPREACQRFLVREQPPSGESPALKRLIGILASIAHAAEQRRGAAAPAHLLAAQVLRERATEAGERRGELLRVAAHERRRKAALASPPEPGDAGSASPAPPSPGPKDGLPARFESIEAFTEWYVGEHGDPGFSEGEWLAELEEATARWRDDHALASEDSPSPALAAPLGAIGHAQLIEARAAERPRITAADASLAALEQCRALVARLPQPADLVGAWFTDTTARRLREADLPTLYTLVQLVNARGKAWWRAVPGLGPVRAARIDAWLQSVGAEAGLALTTDLTVPISLVHEAQARALARRTPNFDQLARHGLEPLAVAAADGEVAGARGAFHVAGNMLGATNDVEALVSALGKYEEHPLTHRLYAVEISRFALWCWRELRRPLSGVTIRDARAYRAFLRDIPPEWIAKHPAPRTSPAWRPFRGQLSPSSIRKALTATSIVMGQLHATGYLSGNPFAGVTKDSALPSPKIDATRSFHDKQWQLVQEMLERQPGERRLAALDRLAARRPEVAEALRRLEFAKARRLRAIVLLLQGTGVRRDELFKARLSDLAESHDDGATDYILTVTGKRSKTREVWMPPEVLAAVREHLADRPLAGFHDDLATQAGLAQIPLVSVLSPALPRPGAALPLAGEIASGCGALTSDGLYKVLKRFFDDVADEAVRRGMDGARFRRASTHWLRHTFGRMHADAGTPTRSIKDAMGHASEATTGIYTKQETKRMIRDLKAAHAAQPSS